MSDTPPEVIPEEAPPEEEATDVPDAPESDETSPDEPVAAEPFDHEVHAPTVAPGTEMPDLAKATPRAERPQRTKPRTDGLGHAGVEGSGGYDPVVQPEPDDGPDDGPELALAE